MSKSEPTIEDDPDGKSKWAPGQMADGSISIFTPDEAAKLVGERDADEQAFNAMMFPEDLDLDAMSEEELDTLIEGLDAEADAQ